MFDEPIKGGLFEGSDIYYNYNEDRSYYNDAYSNISVGDEAMERNYIGKGKRKGKKGGGFFDIVKAVAPFAAKALGSVGSHLLDKSKKAYELSNAERTENQAYLKKLIAQETDPEKRMELIDRLRI